MGKKGKESCYEELSKNKVIKHNLKNSLKEEKYDEDIIIDEICESLDKK